MLDLNRINDNTYLINNFIEVQETEKLLKKKIEEVSIFVKGRSEPVETDGCTIGYSEKVKFEPIDMNKILEKYPMSMYDIYNIKLNANAKDIIKEEGLIQTKIERVLKVTPKTND